MYIPDTTPGDKAKPSFPLCDGSIRPLGDDDSTARALLDTPNVLQWADDVVPEMDAADGLIFDNNDLNSHKFSRLNLSMSKTLVRCLYLY